MNNYTITHCHTMLSNGTTNIDSITKFEHYINRIKECNMQAIAITEHGNCYNWYKKYKTCKENNIKYIFGIEMYITKTLDEKIRDNYHCCLYAKNNTGINEINKLLSIANNRNDNHFYYVPRISIDEFLTISDNIIITSACLGGILASNDEELIEKYLNYFIINKDRCFLEIQHHNDINQIKYNQYLYELHNKYNIPLIVGTDTHALDKKHLKGRKILQIAKKIHFDNEDTWDLVFKTYDELVNAYKLQNSLPLNEVLKAIENTNVLTSMIDEYTFDTKAKYPKLYQNSEQIFREKINKGIKWRGIDKYENYNEYLDKIEYEIETYKHNNAIDFLLLEENYKTEMRNRGIEFGYSRGSCSGSEICYILGITEIDSIKCKLNFERFMNKERVSLADIDTDWYSEDREIVKDYLYNKHGLYCCDIVTFNTIALKGAIRDVGRALEMSLEEVDNICKNIEFEENKYRGKYPELFEYVDILQGVVVSVGSHPSATVVSPIPVDEWFGTFTTSTSKYPISQLNMKEIDSLNFVKLDILGLDNIGIINQTCKLVGIDRLTPNNTPEDDIKVWNSIKENTLGIFQWESNSAFSYLKQLFSDETINKIKEHVENFSYMNLLSIGNGAIRPAGEPYRDELAKGIFRDNGHEALNKFLEPTLGYLVYQEQIIEFLHNFCGYTMGEADVVRRGFAKKTGTEQFIPKIIDGFIKTMKEKYNIEKEQSEVLVKNFIDVIISASDYLFSKNHSDPYSWIGYICGYLRYYYPLEFLTVMFNINKDDEEKTNRITEYTFLRNINIKSPQFRYSKGEYFFDKETNTIYKGIGSIKFLNSKIGDELYNLKNNIYKSFFDLLEDIKANTSINTKQLNLLVKINFFSEFGTIKTLLYMIDIYDKFNNKKSLSRDKLNELGLTLEQVKEYGKETEKKITNLDSERLINDLLLQAPHDEFNIITLLGFQKEILGYIDYKNEKLDKRYSLVQTLNDKYLTKKVNIYCLNNGKTTEVKLSNKVFGYKPFKEGDILYVTYEKLPKSIQDGTKPNGKPNWVKDFTQMEWWIKDYNIIKELDV